MKYLGVIFFALTLAWTWNVVHSESSVPFETHAAIQLKMAEVIQQAILSKKPEATDISIDQVWTDYLGKDRLKTHFSYSFKEPQADNAESTVSQLQGEGILERQAAKGEKDEQDHWALKEVHIASGSIVFEKGLVIDSSVVAEDEVPTPAPEETH